MEELGDTLDIVIIGGYFGERRRQGGQDWTDCITVFLLGIVKNEDQVIPFARVGTGYSMEELDALRQRLRPLWKMYDARAPPSYFGRWSPVMSDRPDVYISDVTKSVVLEVKAGEIVVSDQYPTFYTLRFPRVVKIRYDKDWNEGLN